MENGINLQIKLHSCITPTTYNCKYKMRRKQNTTKAMLATVGLLLSQLPEKHKLQLLHFCTLNICAVFLHSCMHSPPNNKAGEFCSLVAFAKEMNLHLQVPLYSILAVQTDVPTHIHTFSLQTCARMTGDRPDVCATFHKVWVVCIFLPTFAFCLRPRS